jgi:hypothetical protein
MYPKHLLYLVPLFVLLPACEQLVSLDVPATPDRLVVNGFFNPDSTWSVSLYRSAPPEDTVDPASQYVSDAWVVVRAEGGGVVDTLHHVGGGTYRAGTRPEEGRTYTLEVDAPGFGPVLARSQAPEATALTACEAAELEVDDLFSQQLAFTIDDGAGSQIRRLTLTAARSGCVTSACLKQARFRSQDTVLRESFGGIDMPYFRRSPENEYRGFAVFADEAFEGREHALDLRIDERAGSLATSQFMLTITTVSDDYYRYHRTLIEQQAAAGNPLSEPVRVYSNVEGGLGVFAGFTNRTVPILGGECLR